MTFLEAWTLYATGQPTATRHHMLALACSPEVSTTLAASARAHARLRGWDQGGTVDWAKVVSKACTLLLALFPSPHL